MIEPWVYPVLTATAVLTGFIDAIAGGGGLIMLPALLFAGAVADPGARDQQAAVGVRHGGGDAQLCSGRPGELARPQAGHGARLHRRDRGRPPRADRSMPSCSA